MYDGGELLVLQVSSPACDLPLDSLLPWQQHTSDEHNTGLLALCPISKVDKVDTNSALYIHLYCVNSLQAFILTDTSEVVWRIVSYKALWYASFLSVLDIVILRVVCNWKRRMCQQDKYTRSTHTPQLAYAAVCIENSLSTKCCLHAMQSRVGYIKNVAQRKWTSLLHLPLVCLHYWVAPSTLVDHPFHMGWLVCGFRETDLSP